MDLITKIIDIINGVEEEILYDTEANTHHYKLKYINNELHLCLVESYNSYDEEDQISIYSNTTGLESYKCSVEDYCNLIITIMRDKELFLKYGDSQFKHIMFLDCDYI